MTLTESKRDFNEDGTPFYKKHKIYLYKEDFTNFKEALKDVSEFIIKEKGEGIISEKKLIKGTKDTPKEEKEEELSTNFTEVDFDDLGEE